jgi:hypothetical protein
MLLTRLSTNNKASKAATANTILMANKETPIRQEAVMATQTHTAQGQSLSITAAVDIMMMKKQLAAREATVSCQVHGSIFS